MTTRVICIRHGETEWNATGRWQGSAPTPLNDAGRAQAAALATYLAEHDPRPDVLISSPISRARQTAEAIARALDLTITFEDRLREVDLGDWQGLTREEANKWDHEKFVAFDADRYTVPTPNGENRNQLKQRARAAFDDLTQQYAHQTIAIVSHGGTIGMLFESLFGRIERPTISNTSMLVVSRKDASQPWTLEHVAWTPHLSRDPLGETW